MVTGITAATVPREILSMKSGAENKMQMELIEDKIFENCDFSDGSFQLGEYEQCKFIKCNFHNANFKKSVFIDCVFEQCDLSMVKVDKSSFQHVTFLDSKMVGVQFEHLNPFGLQVEFQHVIMDHASFYNAKFPATHFSNCSFKEADFSQSDFTKAIFKNCDFKLAVFNNTILEQVDFISSFNYSIDPSTNKLKKSKHSSSGVLGLLDGIDIIIE